jgi:hypothetical protein
MLTTISLKFCKQVLQIVNSLFLKFKNTRIAGCTNINIPVAVTPLLLVEDKDDHH